MQLHREVPPLEGAVMAPDIVVTAPGAQALFARWLLRGDGVGVFENTDLGHPAMGQMVFAPVTPEEEKKVTIGRTHLPDGAYGLGWRYILKEVVHEIDRFEFKPADA